MCDQILPLVNKVKIHENEEIALTRYAKKVVKSDHKVLELGLELKVHIENKHEERMEYFNVRNKTCQEGFHKFTSREGRFTSEFSLCGESIDV